jgi:hypothetical protein
VLVLPAACGPAAIVGQSESGSGSSSTDTTTETGTDSCVEEFWLETEFVPQHVMLVVDTSRSMATSWDHDDEPVTPAVTRWSLAQALVEQLVATDEQSNLFGVQRFPAATACPGPSCTDADVCVVEPTPEVALAPESAPAILAALPNADASTLVGGSPARAAFISARDALLAGPPEHPKFIVLITDGGANCSAGDSLPGSYEIADEALLTAVEDAFIVDGIYTFVVGVDALDTDVPAGEDTPAGNTFSTLNDLALAGGVPWELGMQARKFHDVRDAEALIVALASVLPFDPACDLDLTQFIGAPTPAQIPFVSFEIDDVVVPQVDDCASEDGWVWLVEGEVVGFCGTACEQFATGYTLHGIYGCEMP